MKQISSLDLRLLALEIAGICPSKLYKVYQPCRKQLVLQFHVRNRGRALLKVRVPNAVYLSDLKENGISNFCSALRKKLDNAFLRKVSQIGFERVLRLDFSSKKENLSLVLEFFSRGNIILLQDEKIIAAEEWQHWSSRDLRPGQDYKPPPVSLDPFSLDGKKLAELSEKTKKTDLVRFLAIDLSLGGVYAEEVCLSSGLDKNSKPSLDGSDAEKIAGALEILSKSLLSPSVIMEGRAVKDAVPLDLAVYKGRDSERFETFSQALEKYYSVSGPRQVSEQERASSKISAIISRQKEAIEAAKEEMERNSVAGRLIYEHYQEVKDLLVLVKKEVKEKGWDGLDGLKNSGGMLKSVEGKSGKIIVEIQ